MWVRFFICLMAVTVLWCGSWQGASAVAQTHSRSAATDSATDGMTDSATDGAIAWSIGEATSAEAGIQEVALGLSRLPAEGFAGVILGLTLPEGAEIAYIHKGNLCESMTLTVHMEGSRVVVLADGEGNNGCDPEGVLVRVGVVLRGQEGDISLRLHSGCVYVYNKNEDIFCPHPLPTVAVTLPAAVRAPTDGTESDREEGRGQEASTEEPMTETTREVADDVEPPDEVPSSTRYVGCQETLVHQGKFSVRFLFSASAQGPSPHRAGMTVYLLPSAGGGGALVDLTVHTAPTITETTEKGVLVHRAATADCPENVWFIHTFSNLSVAQDYHFLVDNGQKVVHIYYKNGAFCG